jgi:hypothetical protein
MRQTVNLKTPFVLAAIATLAIPPSLMWLSTPIALTVKVPFIFVAEAARVALAAEAPFPLGHLDLTVGLLTCAMGHSNIAVGILGIGTVAHVTLQVFSP